MTKFEKLLAYTNERIASIVEGQKKFGEMYQESPPAAFLRAGDAIMDQGRLAHLRQLQGAIEGGKWDLEGLKMHFVQELIHKVSGLGSQSTSAIAEYTQKCTIRSLGEIIEAFTWRT